jgi:hypothetical protein
MDNVVSKIDKIFEKLQLNFPDTVNPNSNINK